MLVFCMALVDTQHQTIGILPRRLASLWPRSRTPPVPPGSWKHRRSCHAPFASRQKKIGEKGGDFLAGREDLRCWKMEQLLNG